MNKKALFCDGTSQYVNPSEPERNEEVVFRFRTAKDDAEHVCLVHEKIRYEMEKAQTGEVFDYYEIKRQLGEEPFRYYFEIRSGSEVCYYNRCGVSERVVSDYDYVVCPGFVHRSGRKAQSCIRYLQIVSATVPLTMMWKTGNITISETTVEKLQTGTAIRQPWMCGNSMVEI